MQRSPTRLRWLAPAALLALFVAAVGFDLVVSSHYRPYEVGDLAIWGRTGLLRLAWLGGAAGALLVGRRRV